MSDTLNTLDELRGIWSYAALDYHHQHGVKDGNEYIITLITLWDKLDTLPLPEVEGVVVELEGRGMGEHDRIDKILLNQVGYYYDTRKEQDSVSP